MSASATVFLLSPANLSGKRGQMVMNPTATFALARALREPAGARLADVFSFVSGLYFRGKVAYAERFGHAPSGAPSAWVMTAGGGLCTLDERVTTARLASWQSMRVSEKNPHFAGPLLREASQLVDQHDEHARFVLLGSVASNKYVVPLLEVLGERLLFPARFAGLGDMSRGSLMLRAAAEQQELEYVRVTGATGAKLSS